MGQKDSDDAWDQQIHPLYFQKNIRSVFSPKILSQAMSFTMVLLIFSFSSFDGNHRIGTTAMGNLVDQLVIAIVLDQR